MTTAKPKKSDATKATETVIAALRVAGALDNVPELPPDAAKLVQRNPHASKKARPVDAEGKPIPKQPSGKYRVIHGSLVIPNDPRSFTNALGQRIPGKPVFSRATLGDIVELSADEATLFVSQGTVEPASIPVSESRMGECWQAPKPMPPNLAARVIGGLGSWGVGAR